VKRAAIAAALCLVAALARAAAPAPPVKPRIFPGIVVDLSTKDGWTLKAKYNPAQEGRMSFLLLHGTGGRKEDWYWLAKRLWRRGYGYLAVDLRGHGESRAAPEGKPAVWRKFVVSKAYNEYLNMAADLEAGVSYLVGQGAPEDGIAIIGADLGGSLGLRYAALHPKVPMIALLSPGMKYQEITTVNAMRAYKDRPILMVYSEADKTSARETPILFSFAKMSVDERKATLIVAPDEHGTRMLRGPVIDAVLDWIRSPVKPDLAVSSGTAVVPADASSRTAEGEDAGEAEAPLSEGGR